MMTKETSPIKRLLPLLQATKVPSAVKTQLLGEFFIYLYKGSSSAQFLVSASELIGQDLSAIKGTLREVQKLVKSSGLLMKDYKGYVFGKFCNMKPSFAEHQVDLSGFEVSATDKRLINMVLLYPPLKDLLNWYVDNGNYALSLADMDAKLTEISVDKNADLRLYTRKFVGKKMKFITQSYGISADTIISELKEAAMFTLMKAYPYWNDDGHMIAMSKIGIHNRGQNFIDEQATQKRMALQKNDDGGYSAVNISWDVIKETTHASFINGSHLTSGIDGSSESPLDRDRRESLYQLTESATLKSKQRLYLKLLLGETDHVFSDFLGEDNSEAAQYMGFERYNRRVCSYLNIPQDAAKAFLASLKAHL